jgi:hypothetical protein
VQWGVGGGGWVCDLYYTCGPTLVNRCKERVGHEGRGGVNMTGNRFFYKNMFFMFFLVYRNDVPLFFCC